MRSAADLLTRRSTLVLGRPLDPLVVSEVEREVLLSWTRRSKNAQSHALRARIVLRCAEGLTNQAVAADLRVRAQTVGKWRRRFVLQRIAGLLDEPRPGTPRKLGDSEIEQVITRTLETKPKDAMHWSVRSMAEATGYSPTSIHRIWRAFQLQPHRSETFKLSTDPQFVEKVRDIVGLYLNPPEKALVLCVDEMSQIQALDRTQPLLPLRPGQVERRTHAYVRYGTTTLFAALDAATGRVMSECRARHRSVDFRKFLDHIEANVPEHLDVHLIMDNHGTHKTALIRRWLQKRPRFHTHFTPTSASWINFVERWFALLSEKQSKRGSHRSPRYLVTAIQRFMVIHDEHPRPFVWTKTADEILQSVARSCLRTSGTGH